MPPALTTPLTVDDCFAELATLTSLDAAEWRDILSLPPYGQRLALQAYRDADWRKEPDRLAAVLAVLEIIGKIAGAVSGVAGAASAVAALRNL